MTNPENRPPVTVLPEGASLRTLVLSDLVRSTNLVETLGDARAAELFRLHDRVARNLLQEHGGLEIDKTDGFLLLFERPWQAVRYALAYHRALVELSESEGLKLAARIGIHLGEVMLHRNKPEDVARGAKPLEVEGLAKPTAARLMSLARGGQTLMTRGAFDLARRSAVGDAAIADDLSWLAHGGYLFKGVQEPMDVFEVGEKGIAPLVAPEGSAKVTRVPAGETDGWRPPEAGVRRPTEVTVGSVLGNYEILKVLGAGGMGEVFLGRDRNLKRRVALKVLKPEMASDATRLARFQREAEAVASLNHPNIVTLYSVEEDRGTRFLTMELVEGERLDRIIPPGGMELDKLFNVALRLTDAVASAHRNGIAHRDLKAANVMVTVEERVKILDFGLAKLLDDEESGKWSGVRSVESLSESGLVIGTVPYMSPEQVSGRPVDHRTDIFSLGVLMFEMAVGRRPFSGDSSADLVASILRDVPGDVTELRSDLPRDLGRILQRCLEKDPDRRYQSALELLDELEGLRMQVVSGEVSVTAPPASPSATPGDAGRKGMPKMVAPAAAAILVVIVGLWALRSMTGSRETGPENGGEPSVPAAAPPAEAREAAASLPSSAAGTPDTSGSETGEEASTATSEPSAPTDPPPVETRKPEPKPAAPPPRAVPAPAEPPPASRVETAETTSPQEPSLPMEAAPTGQPGPSPRESQGGQLPVSPPPPVETAPKRETSPVREPVAAEPASEPEAPVVSLEEEKEAVSRTLRQYENAMEMLDAAAVKEVWPGVDEARERKRYSELTAQELDLDCEISVSDDRATATATCRTTMRHQRKRGFSKPTEFTWIFSLAKRDGGWLITGREASSS